MERSAQKDGNNRRCEYSIRVLLMGDSSRKMELPAEEKWTVRFKYELMVAWLDS